MTHTTTTHAFNRGYNFGVFVSEFLKICRASFQKADQTSPQAVIQPARAVLNTQTDLSDAQIERLSKLPAMARLGKVDLCAWYETNVKELPLKKRRSRSIPRKQAAQMGKVMKFGPLNDLIEPIASDTPDLPTFRPANEADHASLPQSPDLSDFELETGPDSSWEK